MRDDSRKINIDNQDYYVEATFDRSPAIFQAAAESQKFYHFHKNEDAKMNIASIVEGFNDSDCVLILARKVTPSESKTKCPECGSYHIKPHTIDHTERNELYGEIENFGDVNHCLDCNLMF